MKASEIFEGPNSSLRKAFDEACEPSFVGGFQDGGEKLVEVVDEMLILAGDPDKSTEDLRQAFTEKLIDYATIRLLSERARVREMVEGMRKGQEDMPAYLKYNRALTDLLAKLDKQ